MSDRGPRSGHRIVRWARGVSVGVLIAVAGCSPSPSTGDGTVVSASSQAAAITGSVGENPTSPSAYPGAELEVSSPAMYSVPRCPIDFDLHGWVSSKYSAVEPASRNDYLVTDTSVSCSASFNAGKSNSGGLSIWKQFTPLATELARLRGLGETLAEKNIEGIPANLWDNSDDDLGAEMSLLLAGPGGVSEWYSVDCMGAACTYGLQALASAFITHLYGNSTGSTDTPAITSVPATTTKSTSTASPTPTTSKPTPTPTPTPTSVASTAPSWPDPIKIGLAPSPKFEEEMDGWRLNQQWEDTVRAFDGQWTAASGTEADNYRFPGTQNGCDQQKFLVRWRSLNPSNGPIEASWTGSAFVGSTHTEVRQVDGTETTKGDAGWMVLDGCETPVFTFVPGSGGAGNINDVAIAVQQWFASAA